MNEPDQLTHIYRAFISVCVVCIIGLLGYYGARVDSRLDTMNSQQVSNTAALAALSARLGSLERAVDRFEDRDR